MKTLPYIIKSDGQFWQIAKVGVKGLEAKTPGVVTEKVIKYPSTLRSAAETVRELLLADALYTPEAQLTVETILAALDASDATLKVIVREATT